MNGRNKLCNTNGTSVDLNSEVDSDCDSVSSFGSAIRTSRLLQHELVSLDQKLMRTMLIQQTDRSYYMALSDIRHQTIISVVVEPSFYGRHCNTSVIVIATSNNTYVFDLRALGAIYRELSVLLEAEFPRKIMHHSHRICDLLFHQHKLKINSICDTFVALCVARQDRRNITLKKAISLVFNIPLSKLSCDELQGESESHRSFSARPLSKGQLMYLATIAILQGKLHDRLIYGNICHDLQQMSVGFSCEYTKNKVSSEVALNMQPSSKAGFDCIDQFYKISAKID